MPPTLSAAGVAALLVLLWLLGRPRPKLTSRQDSSAIAALNRGQIVRVLDPGPPKDGAPVMAPEPTVPLPRSAGERQRFLAQLERWSRGSSEERLRAMRASAAWGQRSALPVLLRGRHDPDPRVAWAAAQALERFRGRSAAPGSNGAQAPRPPRNISRTL